MEQTSNEPGAVSAEERAAARWNNSDGVRRHGPAFARFAEAVGHLRLVRDPDLFSRSLVGSWPTIDIFVDEYIRETDLEDQLGTLPERLRPYVGIDRQKVVEAVAADLLVLTTEDERVWVFDADPVVKTTVEETQQVAHSE